ncbi:hypothetical protein [Micromonospora aurantiaca (nom. illeg.)]
MTITGSEVCYGFAGALIIGSATGGIPGSVCACYGVWAMILRKIRRSSE